MKGNGYGDLVVLRVGLGLEVCVNDELERIWGAGGFTCRSQVRGQWNPV